MIVLQAAGKIKLCYASEKKGSDLAHILLIKNE